MKLYQIDTGYACAGVVVNNKGIVIRTAPIFRWMLRKTWNRCRKWPKIKTIKRAYNAK